jgi:hypothetical protein
MMDSKRLFYVIIIALLLSLVLLNFNVIGSSGSVSVPKDYNYSIYSWTSPYSSLWDVIYDFNLSISSPDNISIKLYENSTLIQNYSVINSDIINLTGNYTREYTESTSSANFKLWWDVPSESINWSEVFNTWNRFSHSSAGDDANPSEMTSWSYDSENDIIQSTINSGTNIGFYSNENYSQYGFETVLKSTATDNDMIGVVLAFEEVEGVEHSLIAIRTTGGVGPGGFSTGVASWAIVYDYNKVPYTNIADKTEIISYGGNWNSYPLGTKVWVERDGDIIKAKTTQLNSHDYVPESELTVNLSDPNFPELQIFKGSSPIGFAAHSQASASFSEVYFSSSVGLVDWNVQFQCHDIGCPCNVNLDCTSGNCRKNTNSSEFYCAEPDDDCSIEYEGISLDIGESSGSWLCRANDDSYQCNATTICDTFNGKYCSVDQTWETGNGTSHVCFSNPYCVSESYFVGKTCDGGVGVAGSCSVTGTAYDKDDSQSYCTSSATDCTQRTWFSNLGYSSNPNLNFCCGDDVNENWFTYSGNLTSTNQSSCRLCLSSVDYGTLTLYGNGGVVDSTCFYGDISCNLTSYNNGTNCTLSNNEICVDGIGCSSCGIYNKTNDFSCYSNCNNNDDLKCWTGYHCNSSNLCSPDLSNSNFCEENSDCISNVCLYNQSFSNSLKLCYDSDVSYCLSNNVYYTNNSIANGYLCNDSSWTNNLPIIHNIIALENVKRNQNLSLFCNVSDYEIQTELDVNISLKKKGSLNWLIRNKTMDYYNSTFDNSSSLYNYNYLVRESVGTQYEVQCSISDLVELVNLNDANLTSFDNTNITIIDDWDFDDVSDDEDRILGTGSTLNTTLSLVMEVDNSPNYNTTNETKVVTIKKADIKLIEFKYNFTKKILDTSNITIEVNDESDNESFIIIKGLELDSDETKNITLPKKNQRGKVCIKDAPVLSISEISSSCNGTNETLFNYCTSVGQTIGNYTCRETNDGYFITGLRNSAGKEMGGTTLRIYDDSDLTTKRVGDSVKFYANFSDGSSMINSNCSIRFSTSQNYTLMSNSSGLYYYTKTFTSVTHGTFFISCFEGATEFLLNDTYDVFAQIETTSETTSTGPSIVPPPRICGDGICIPIIGENCSSCPKDCGICESDGLDSTSSINNTGNYSEFSSIINNNSSTKVNSKNSSNILYADEFVNDGLSQKSKLVIFVLIILILILFFILFFYYREKKDKKNEIELENEIIKLDKTISETKKKSKKTNKKSTKNKKKNSKKK